MSEKENSIRKLLDPAMSQSALEDDENELILEKEEEKEVKKEHAPGEEHPRFKEIYGNRSG